MQTAWTCRWRKAKTPFLSASIFSEIAERGCNLDGCVAHRAIGPAAAAKILPFKATSAIGAFQPPAPCDLDPVVLHGLASPPCSPWKSPASYRWHGFAFSSGNLKTARPRLYNNYMDIIERPYLESKYVETIDFRQVLYRTHRYFFS